VTAKKVNNSSGVALAKNGITAKIATLTIQNGCFAGLEIPLKKAKTLLGRDLSCDVCLDDSLVSSEHAVVVRSNGSYILEDLNSRNGTCVDGESVQKKKLKNGSKISIGNFLIRFSRK
jgi:pSer/pThr/pTyr-binding forkhead associated (FHA) protein